MKVSREATPQALHHFNHSNHVNQVIWTSEADAALGFMERLLALCLLPRTNPGNRLRYRRGTSSPSANLPRLMFARPCTEAVQTTMLQGGSREIAL